MTRIYFVTLWFLWSFPLLVKARVETESVSADRNQVEIDPSGELRVAEMLHSCEQYIARLFHNDLFTAKIHRNGENKSCGEATVSLKSLHQAAARLGDCSTAEIDKYHVESILTQVLANALGEKCSNAEGYETPATGFLGHCDWGPEHTVVQLDHQTLVPVPPYNTLPCRFYTREGLRISSFQQLSELLENSSTLHLYAAPAGRVFMFAPSHVGEVFELHHVKDSMGQSLALEVLSMDPRLFDIRNFFSEEEAQALIDKALAETSASHKLHRSTTGTVGGSVFEKRTSENAWDTHGKLAQEIKRRSFTALGLDQYHESMSDGLQILRYNLTTAYIGHMDTLDDAAGNLPYDYEPSGRGGNRFATILLYMSDVESGGETVFPKAWPPNTPDAEKLPTRTLIKQMRKAGEISMLKEGSWEEEMTAQCRSRLSVKPNASRAVLFYSQFPNGIIDPMSFHGGCPVTKGTKWAANLWVWNAPRPEYEGAPFKFDPDDAELIPDLMQQIQAIFRNSGKDPRFDKAELYFDETGFFGKLGPSDPPLYINTYHSHRWNIKVDGEILKTIDIVNNGEREQEFVI